MRSARNHFFPSCSNSRKAAFWFSAHEFRPALRVLAEIVSAIVRRPFRWASRLRRKSKMRGRWILRKESRAGNLLQIIIAQIRRIVRIKTQRMKNHAVESDGFELIQLAAQSFLIERAVDGPTRNRSVVAAWSLTRIKQTEENTPVARVNRNCHLIRDSRTKNREPVCAKT